MIKKILFWLVTVTMLLIIILPLVWIYLTAFKAQTDVFSKDLVTQVVFKPTLKTSTTFSTNTPSGQTS